MAIKDLRATYAGSQLQAAGLLVLAADTRRILTILRSAKVVDPNVWCSAGGKIEKGESPRQAALREFQEEVGILAEVKIFKGMTYESETLKFYNHVGLVEAEHYPHLNWESSGYAWTTLDMIPEPWHFGLEAQLKDSGTADLLTRLIDFNGDLWNAPDLDSL